MRLTKSTKMTAYNPNSSNQIVSNMSPCSCATEMIVLVPIQLLVIISDRKKSANPVSMDAENAAKKDMALECDGGQ